jgi:hypothetical protein
VDGNTSALLESTSESAFFWVDSVPVETVKEMISMFRNEYKPPLTLWIENNNYNSDTHAEDELAGLLTLSSGGANNNNANNNSGNATATAAAAAVSDDPGDYYDPFYYYAAHNDT